MAGKRFRPGKKFRSAPVIAALLCLLCVSSGQERAAAGVSGILRQDTTPAAPPDTPDADTADIGDTSLPDSPDTPSQPEKPLWTPVAESTPVTDDYFDDVAFVGDSRTDGFRLYSGLNRGAYFCVTGETVVSAVEQQNWKTDSGKKISLADAVAGSGCGKIYLMLGVNELGWNGTEIFRSRAEALVQKLLADAPDAELVIQSLLPVTASQDEKGSYVNNRRISAYNRVWMELSQQYGCPYLNVAEALTDENGCLPEEMSFDGVHLNRAGCGRWLDYLRTHNVPDTAPAETDE